MKSPLRATIFILFSFLCIPLHTRGESWFGATVNINGADAVADLKQMSTEKLEQLKVILLVTLNYGLNEARLIPGHALGTTCMIGAISMYWQALNDYLNDTATTDEGKQLIRKKILGKIKAGSGFFTLGTAIFYYNSNLAQHLLGYDPKATEKVMKTLA